ncbi:MAG TPA: quinone oxidoreductase [Gemmatimonadaceae bacterium]
MRAIRIHQNGGPEVLQVDEVPDPVPAADELLIDVEAVGINFIEIYQREGLYPRPLPVTMGAEAAGTVRSIGSSVTGFKPGDRVVSQRVKGAYAERAVVPAIRAVQIPAGVSTKQAAAAWLQGLTAHYLVTTTFPLHHGHRALVHAAAGGVGLMLCQMAKMRGATIYGTASTEAKRALAHEAGADETIDYTSADFTAEVKRLTNGAGVNVVYDSVGKTTFDKSLDCLMRRGMMVLFGQSSGPVPAFDPQILNRKGSLFLTRPKLDDYIHAREELESRSRDLFSWIERGELKVRIGAEFPLHQVAEAHRELQARQTTGKVVLVV